MNIDNLNKLIKELLKEIPEEFVLQNRADLTEYAADKTPDLKAEPDLVVIARDAEDISLLLKLANSYKIPVIPRGGGTGVTGGALATEGGIILSLEKMNKIIEIDTDNMIAVVEPGVITGRLQEAVLEYGLMYPPDPASLDKCSLGGNLAESAGGLRAVKYGTTKDYILGVEYVTPQGDILRSGGKFVKNATGYNMTGILIGSEGTLAVVTKIFLKLIPAPAHTFNLLIPFESIDSAIEAVFEITKAKIIPSTIEFMEADAISLVAKHSETKILFPEAGAHLLIQLDGNSEAELELQFKKMIDHLGLTPDQVVTAQNESEYKQMWAARRGIRDSIVAENPIFFAEDTVVPRSLIPDFVKEVKKELNKLNLRSLLFGHAGDGNVHTDILKGDMDYEKWREMIPRIKEIIYRIAIKYEGTISGEHGIGHLRKDYLSMAHSDAEIELMKAVKRAFDPNNILNPGKIFSFF